VPTWARYDAYTGNLLDTIVNATTGAQAQIFGPKGELLLYYFNLASKSLALWNSSKIVTALYSQTSQANIPWKNGIQWNVTVPTSPGEAVDIGTTTWDPKNPTEIIVTNQTNGNPVACGAFTDIAYSTTDGHELWSQTRNTGGDTWEQVLFSSRAMGDGIYTIYRKETRQVYAFNATTGDQMWVSDARTNALCEFAAGLMFAYGKIYVAGYDGVLYAYDEQTGKTVWSWYDNSVNPSGLATPYGQYPFYGATLAADGMIFIHNQEHTEQSPLFTGEDMYAINASTGQEIWALKGQYKELTLAGGYIVAPNECDGQIYTIGKGPSAITIAAPSIGVTTATPLTITGTTSPQDHNKKT
jgi:outer membrane protein assembly factor BamB